MNQTEIKDEASPKEPYGYTLGWPCWRQKVLRSLKDPERKGIGGQHQRECTVSSKQRLRHMGGMKSWSDLFPGTQSKSSAEGSGKYAPNSSRNTGTLNQESTVVRSFQKRLLFHRCYSWSSTDRLLVAIGHLLLAIKSQQYRQGQADRGQNKVCRSTHVCQHMSPMLPLKSP